MRRGRPSQPAPALVEPLEGSIEAKTRLSVMLQTLTGELTVPQACRRLRIGRSRFFALRQEALLQTLAAMEPKPRGRPSSGPSEQNAQIAALRGQVQALKVDLRAAQIREELAMLMPHVLRPRKAHGVKKKVRSRSRTQPGHRAPQRQTRPDDP